MFPFLSRSLVLRFNAIILSSVIVCLLIMSVLLGEYNRRTSIAELENKAQKMVDLGAMSLQEPLFSFNKKAIDNIIDALLLDEDILAVQVYEGEVDEEAGPLLFKKRPAVESFTFQEMKSHPDFLYSIGITRLGENYLGEVHIVTSKLRVLAVIEESTQIIATSTVVLIGIIGVLVWLSGRKILNIPIHQLTKSADQLAHGFLEVKIDTKRSDELGDLARSFDDMRKAIQKKLADLKVLNTTGETMAGFFKQTEILRTTFDIMQSQTGIERGSIYLLNKNEELELYSVYPEQENPRHAKVFKMGEGIAGSVAQNQEVVSIPDTSKAGNYVMREGEHPKALLCIPMVDNHKTFGVMNFSGKAAGVRFDQDDKNFAETLARMTVVCTKNIQMFNLIEEHNRTLEKKIQERTAALRDLMDNSGQGFLTFDAHYKVQPEYSKACETFFQKPIAGSQALELLYGDRNQERQLFDIVFAETSDLEVLGDLLPQEIEIGHRRLAVEYRKIEPSDDSTQDMKVMIVLTDVTLERQLEAMQRENEERNERILKIAGDKEGFILFLRGLEGLFETIQTMLEAIPAEMDLHALFRQYHTIKGGAASYALEAMAQQAHHIESKLEPLRSDPNAVTSHFIEDLHNETEELQTILHQCLDDLKGLVSEEEWKVKGEISFKVPDSKIEKSLSLLSQITNPNPVSTQLHKTLLNMRLQPIGPVLHKYAFAAEALAHELGKSLKVQTQGEQEEVFFARLEPLFSVLIHLVRNAVDHGLESPEMRADLGKSKTGHIGIVAEHTPEALLLTISDDGQGLDPQKIKQSALDKKIMEPQQLDELDDASVFQLIFHPGFSTKTEVSDVSGRGVGMDAVQAELNALGGQLQIETEINKGTTFKVQVPLSPNV